MGRGQHDLDAMNTPDLVSCRPELYGSHAERCLGAASASDGARRLRGGAVAVHTEGAPFLTARILRRPASAAARSAHERAGTPAGVDLSEGESCIVVAGRRSVRSARLRSERSPATPTCGPSDRTADRARAERIEDEAASKSAALLQPQPLINSLSV